MKRTYCWIGILALSTTLASNTAGSRAMAAELGPGSTYSLSSYLPDDDIPPPPPPPGTSRGTADRDPQMPPLPPPSTTRGTRDTDSRLPPPAANKLFGTQEVTSTPATCASCQGTNQNLVQEYYCPLWTITAGAIVWTRSAPASSTWLTDGVGNGLLDPHSFNLGWNAGPRIDLVRHFDGWDFEVLYFSIDGWSDDRNFANGMYLSPLTAAPGLTAADFLYTSRLYNLETNVKMAVSPRIDLLAGFRWLQLDEQVNFTGMATGGPGAMSQTTDNNLYGFQLGVEGRVFDHGGPFWIDGLVKAGVYDAHINGSFAETGSFGATLANSVTDHAAFVGDVGVTAHYQICRHLAAYGGYELMWVDGVTLAPDALSSQSLARNSPLYHGAIAGLELTW